MAQGGARQGAGRPRGSPARLDYAARLDALQSGLSPLAYLLSILRDEARDDKTRIDVAKAALPYCHAKIADAAMTAEPPDPDAPPQLPEWFVNRQHDTPDEFDTLDDGRRRRRPRAQNDQPERPKNGQ